MSACQGSFYSKSLNRVHDIRHRVPIMARPEDRWGGRSEAHHHPGVRWETHPVAHHCLEDLHCLVAHRYPAAHPD